MSDSLIGKDAEKKIQEWLDRKEDGYSFDRIKDQMTQPASTEAQTSATLSATSTRSNTTSRAKQHMKIVSTSS